MGNRLNSRETERERERELERERRSVATKGLWRGNKVGRWTNIYDS